MSFLLSAEFPLEVVTALPLPPPWKCVDGIYLNEITGETNEKHPFVVALELLNESNNDPKNEVFLTNQEVKGPDEGDSMLNTASLNNSNTLLTETMNMNTMSTTNTPQFVDFKCNWEKIGLFEDRDLFGLTIRYYENGVTCLKFDGANKEWIETVVEGPNGPVDRYDLFIDGKVKIFGRTISISTTCASNCHWIYNEGQKLLKKQSWLQSKIESIGAVPVVKRPPPKVAQGFRAAKSEGQTNLRRIVSENIKLGEQMVDLGLGHFLMQKPIVTILPKDKLSVPLNTSIYNSVASSQ